MSASVEDRLLALEKAVGSISAATVTGGPHAVNEYLYPWLDTVKDYFTPEAIAAVAKAQADAAVAKAAADKAAADAAKADAAKAAAATPAPAPAA